MDSHTVSEAFEHHGGRGMAELMAVGAFWAREEAENRARNKVRLSPPKAHPRVPNLPSSSLF